jgi:RNA polymerase sigma factor (sigma-70 family)
VQQQLNKLVTEHYREVRFRFGQLVSDPHVADDLTQRVFLAVCSKVAKEEAVDNWRGFISGVSANVFREHLRNKSRAQATLGENMENCITAEASPLDDVERREMSGKLLQILRRLGPKHREIVTAVHIFGLSVKETGELLGMSKRKVLYSLTCALEQMREMAENEGLVL